MFIVKAAAIAAALVCVAGGTASAHAGAPTIFQAVTVFAIGPEDSYVAEYSGTPGQWTIIGGPATSVYAGSAGVFAVSPGSGDIYQYDGTPGQWTAIGGPGSFTEAGSHLYGLGPNGAYVAEYDGTPNEWTIVRSQGAWAIYGGADGLFAVSRDNAQDVLQYNGTPGDWTNLEFGPVLRIAVGTNSVYADSLNGQDVEQWIPGSGWIKIGPPTPGQSGDGLVAGGGGLVMAIPSAGEVVKYNGTPGSWSVISTDPTLGALTVSTDYIYGIDFAGTTTAVDVYSGSGTQWTVIGGPASAPLGAGD